MKGQLGQRYRGVYLGQGRKMVTKSVSLFVGKAVMVLIRWVCFYEWVAPRKVMRA